MPANLLSLDVETLHLIAQYVISSGTTPPPPYTTVNGNGASTSHAASNGSSSSSRHGDNEERTDNTMDSPPLNGHRRESASSASSTVPQQGLEDNVSLANLAIDAASSSRSSIQDRYGRGHQHTISSGGMSGLDVLSRAASEVSASSSSLASFTERVKAGPSSSGPFAAPPPPSSHVRTQSSDPVDSPAASTSSARSYLSPPPGGSDPLAHPPPPPRPPHNSRQPPPPASSSSNISSPSAVLAGPLPDSAPPSDAIYTSRIIPDPRALLPLMLTCKKMHTALQFSENPWLYRWMYMETFDIESLVRRWHEYQSGGLNHQFRSVEDQDSEPDTDASPPLCQLSAAEHSDQKECTCHHAHPRGQKRKFEQQGCFKHAPHGRQDASPTDDYACTCREGVHLMGDPKLLADEYKERFVMFKFLRDLVRNGGIKNLLDNPSGKERFTAAIWTIYWMYMENGAFRIDRKNVVHMVVVLTRFVTFY